MRDYFRNERISFKYMPVFYLTRIMIAVMILFCNSVQWAILMIGAMSSFGFRFESEEEYVLPMTDEELRRRKLIRCNAIWLRYFLLSAISNVFAWFFPDAPYVLRGGMMERPVIFLAFWLLQSIIVYEVLFEKVVTPAVKNKWNHTVFGYVCSILPSIVLFGYGINSARFLNKNPFFLKESEWIHVSILLVAAVLVFIYCAKLLKEWRLKDFNAVSETTKSWKNREVEA